MRKAMLFGAVLSLGLVGLAAARPRAVGPGGEPAWTPMQSGTTESVILHYGS